MSGCLNKLIPKMILIIVALLLVAAVGGAITEDGNQDAFDTAMEEQPFAGPISKVLCNLMKLDKGEELLSANDLITDVLKILKNFAGNVSNILTIVPPLNKKRKCF